MAAKVRQLPKGSQVHAQRPGPCRDLVIVEQRKNAVVVDGGPVRVFTGIAMKLLHLPGDCPFRRQV